MLKNTQAQALNFSGLILNSGFFTSAEVVFRSLQTPDLGYSDENPDDPYCISFLCINFDMLQIYVPGV